MNEIKLNVFEKYYKDNAYIDPVDKLNIPELESEMEKIKDKKSKFSKSQRERVFKNHKTLKLIEKLQNQKEEINVPA